MPSFILPAEHSYELTEKHITSSLYKEFTEAEYEHCRLMLSEITEGRDTPKPCDDEYLIVFHQDTEVRGVESEFTGIAFCIMRLNERRNESVTFYVKDLTFRASTTLTNKVKYAIIDTIHAWTNEIMMSEDVSQFYAKCCIAFCVQSHTKSCSGISMALCDTGHVRVTDETKSIFDFYTRECFIEPSSPSRVEPMPLW